jgi:hypothetical protein
MAEEVEIAVELAAEYHDETPEVEFLLDDTLIENCRITEKFKEKNSRHLTWSGELNEGQHILKIRLKNKDGSQTVIGANGDILADQLLHIVSIKIDQIDLGSLRWSLGKFYPDRDKHSNLDEMIPGLTCIGYNGEYQLEFSAPTYLWLLEHF